MFIAYGLMLRATFETGMRMLSRASLGHMHKLSHGPAEVREENFRALYGTPTIFECYYPAPVHAGWQRIGIYLADRPQVCISNDRGLREKSTNLKLVSPELSPM